MQWVTSSMEGQRPMQCFRVRHQQLQLPAVAGPNVDSAASTADTQGDTTPEHTSGGKTPGSTDLREGEGSGKGKKAGACVRCH